MKNGIYIYGIANASVAQIEKALDLGEKAPTRVMSIGFKEIAAVVTSLPFKAYDSLGKEEIVQDLATHELVIEKVMQRFTIIPVKFGTMVESEDEVTKFLEHGYVLLKNELDKATGKIELDVVAWWDVQKILATLPRQNEQIQAKEQEIAMKGAEVSTEDKIMLGQLIKQALEAEKAKYQQIILETLKQEAIDVCWHELASDKVLLNTAFLLEKTKEKSFDATLHSLDQKLEGTVNFRVVGPLPLYSFSTILFKKLDPERIEEAKKVLGLTGEITEKTLRGTYHRLAQKYHPDVQSGEDTTQEFEQIHNAYSTLKDFIENGLLHVEVHQWKEELQ